MKVGLWDHNLIYTCLIRQAVHDQTGNAYDMQNQRLLSIDDVFINRLNILIVVLDSVRFYMLGYEWTVALPMHISIGKTLFQVLRAPVAVSKVHTTSFSNARTTYYSETDTFQTTSTNSTLMICFTVYPMPLRQRMKYCSLKSKTLYFILKGSFK